MSAEGLFRFANTFALCGWILLVFLPAWTWTRRLTSSILPLALSASYFAVLAFAWPHAQGGFSSLPAVRQLFSDDWLLLGGWIHYLAFDLLVGSREADDCLRRGIPHLLLVPCLCLTFLFGPVGWLSFQVIRKVHGRKENFRRANT